MAAVLYAPPALAQIQFGQIQGVVTNKDTGKRSPVTVVVSGPAMQGDQTEVTDGGGPIPDYPAATRRQTVVRFYFNDVVVERPGVRVGLNKTLTIPVTMPTQKGSADRSFCANGAERRHRDGQHRRRSDAGNPAKHCSAWPHV